MVHNWERLLRETGTDTSTDTGTFGIATLFCFWFFGGTDIKASRVVPAIGG